MRGRVEFESGGEVHALRFTTNRLCRLEELTGRGVIEWGQMVEDGKLSMRDMRALFACGLDGEQEVSESAAGDIIDGLGVSVAGDLVGRALIAAFAQDGKKDPAAAGGAGKK